MARQSVVDRDTFRAVMRKHASSVTVITTSHDGRLHGMTATAFCSVSADPPTILIVVNRSARSHPLIDGSGFFAVNILSERQVELAERFSAKRDDQFDALAYTIGETGAPILAGVTAHIECRVASRTEIETHTLFVGRVIDGSAADSTSLVYEGGRYVRLSERG